MKRFKQFLIEALPISMAREIRKKLQYNKIIDKNNGRVYLELSSAKELDVSRIKTGVRHINDITKAMLYGFTHGQVQQFKKNIISKFTDYNIIPDNTIIEEYLLTLGYSIEDYRRGIAVKVVGGNMGKKIRIGKLLSNNKPMKKIFDEDPTRSGAKRSVGNRQLIVISSHSYDVAGGSTDRGWRSCLGLEPNDLKMIKDYPGVDSYDLSNARINQHIFCDVEAGSLIAYLITENDLNIKKPLARVMIRPYSDVLSVSRSESAYSGTILFMTKEAFGNPTPIFLETIEKWLKRGYTGSEGIYVVNPNVYQAGHAVEVMKKSIKGAGKTDLLQGKIRKTRLYVQIQLQLYDEGLHIDQIAMGDLARTKVWMEIEKILNMKQNNIPTSKVGVDVYWSNWDDIDVEMPDERDRKDKGRASIVVQSDYDWAKVKVDIKAPEGLVRALRDKFDTDIGRNDYDY